MSGVTRNLQLLWRSERTLADVRLRLTSRKLVLVGIAGIACLFALAMFNIAGFFALMPSVGNSSAALIVGFADAIIAGLLAVVAQGLRAGPEEDMLHEVRATAIGELGAEGESIQQKLLQMGDDIQAVKTRLADFSQQSLDAQLRPLIVPMLTAVTKLVKSRTAPS